MEADIDRRRLGSYLNNHLAGSTAGVRIARRVAEENGQSEYGTALGRMLRELEEERGVLLKVLHKLDLPENPLKKFLGWTAEKVEELGVKGDSHGSTPMKRLLDLEALLLGTTGARCLWQTLELVAVYEPALADFDFTSLQERAGRRVSRLGQLRLEARLPAFAGKERGPAVTTGPVSSETSAAQAPAITAPRAAEPSAPARYTGPERRSGRERRVHPITTTTMERRGGSDRRASTAL